jgi:hypothetical protein
MHSSISGMEAADRLAIRELVEACAHCADRRDAKGQISLFTPDTTSSSLWMLNPLSLYGTNPRSSLRGSKQG